MFIRLHAMRWVLTALFCAWPWVSAMADDGEQADEPDVEYRVSQVAAGSGGVYTYKAGEWGLLRLILTNNQDVPVELDCSTYFDVESTLQYGCRIWMPAMSRVMTTHPILLPETFDVEDERVRFHTQVVDVSSGDRDQIRDDVGKLQYANDLQVQTQDLISGVVIPFEDADNDVVQEYSPYDLITMGRLEVQLPRRLSRYGDRVLPSNELGLATLDQLVLADDRFLGDAGAIAAIRNWLYGGGRLWIMLDRVNPELLNALLGDESGCQVIDTVTLNHLTISSTRERGGFPDIVTEFETPRTLVRVVVDDEDVPVLVNGWPAAFQRMCGEGRLLVTTLSGDAWLTKKSLSEMVRPGQRAEEQWPYASTPAFQHLMTFFFQEADDDAPVVQTFEPRLREFVGYSIPGKGMVVGLLAAFMVLLGGGGYWLLRSGRLERLGFLTPLIAIISAGALIVIGQQHRQAVPPSTAMLQVVHPIPGTDGVRVSGAAALYSPDSRVSELQGAAGGWITPQLEGTEGTIRRMMWSDIDQWEWEDLPQPPGLRTAEFEISMQVPERVSAKAVFGPDGLTGELSTPEGMIPVDAIVATRNGRIAAELQDDGSFVASNNQVLGPDEYLRAGLLDDDQARRSNILAELFQQPSHSRMLEPNLMFWTAPWQAGLGFAGDAQESGMALVVIPLELQRPAAGTEISLPAPLVAYRETSGPDGYQPSGLFDARTGVWAQRTRPSTSWLNFEFPKALSPLEVQSAVLEIRVTGPIGKIELGIAHGEEVVDLTSWTDPVGTLTYEISGDDLPAAGSNHGLLLRLAAGDPDRPELTADPDTGKQSYWRIESLTLEVDGIVLPREVLAGSP